MATRALGPLRVVFHNEGQKVPDVRRAAAAGARAAFRHEGLAGRRVNVIWTSRERLRRLNVRFRTTDRFTDVIAFRYEERREPGFRLPARPPVFGDLYIAVAQGRMNAKRFGVSFAEELVRLVVHGSLHLLGYTDYVPREKKKMWALQEKIVGRLLRKGA